MSRFITVLGYKVSDELIIADNNIQYKIKPNTFYAIGTKYWYQLEQINKDFWRINYAVSFVE